MTEPTLNPMRGRVVVELVDRMTRFPDESKWAKLVHAPHLEPGEMDQRKQYQPYLGKIIAFGEPTDDEEAALLADAKARTEAGERFIFTWGAGIDFSCETMMMLEGPNDEPRFRWLMKKRIFRIRDLAASIAGGDEFGGTGEPDGSTN